MGLNLPFRNQRNGAPPAQDEALQDRFGANFPRLFAYVRSCVGDDAAAKEIVVDAFCRAFGRYSHVADSEFRLLLFRTAHSLCRSAAASKARDDSLSPREREVVSLLFDAELTRGEIARLLHSKESAVTAALIRALSKLRDGTSPAVVAAYLQRS